MLLDQRSPAVSRTCEITKAVKWKHHAISMAEMKMKSHKLSENKTELDNRMASDLQLWGLERFFLNSKEK
jgi:hypothetical protein